MSNPVYNGHQQAMDLAEKAHLLYRQGKREEAKPIFAEAYELELRAADACPASSSKSVMYQSAAFLACGARLWAHAEACFRQILPEHKGYQECHLTACERICGFARLNSIGWDSYGAEPVTEAAILSALELSEYCNKNALPAWWVVPTCRGGVQFEWKELIFGLEAELEVMPDGAYDLALFSADNNREWSIPFGKIGGKP